MGSSSGEVRSRSAKRRPASRPRASAISTDAARFGLQVEPIRRRLAIDVHPVEVLLRAHVAGELEARGTGRSARPAAARAPAAPRSRSGECAAALRRPGRTGRARDRRDARGSASKRVLVVFELVQILGIVEDRSLALQRSSCGTPARRASCSSGVLAVHGHAGRPPPRGGQIEPAIAGARPPGRRRGFRPRASRAALRAA